MGAAQLDGDGAYLVEMRPADGARNVIVRRTLDGVARDVTDAPFDGSTCAPVCTSTAGGLCASGASSAWCGSPTSPTSGVYRQETGPAPVAITPAGVDLRFGDGMVDWERGRLVCVR